MDANYDIEEAKTNCRYSSLHACAKGGFADTTEVILNPCCTHQNLDAKMLNGMTLLVFAAQSGAHDVAKLLLEQEATVPT